MKNILDIEGWTCDETHKEASGEFSPGAFTVGLSHLCLVLVIGAA